MTDTIHSSDGKVEMKEVIEVTPAMIEAGVEELYRDPIMDPDDASMSKAVLKVFIVMMKEARKA
jgi:hypothetical protein